MSVSIQPFNSMMSQTNCLADRKLVCDIAEYKQYVNMFLSAL